MAKTRKKLLIVDGYNVLRSGSRYKRITSPDYTDDTFNTARERLINDVINFAGRDYKAVIVFDGAQNEFSSGSTEKRAGVQIMFSRAGESADKVIEKLAHDARERMIETLVVTSDATIQDTVFGGGVDRMSADGFSGEEYVAVYDRDYRADLYSAGRELIAEAAQWTTVWNGALVNTDENFCTYTDMNGRVLFRYPIMINGD